MTRTGHKHIRTVVTIYDSVYERAEKWRQEFDMSRSQFYSEAVQMQCIRFMKDYPESAARIIHGKEKGADNG